MKQRDSTSKLYTTAAMKWPIDSEAVAHFADSIDATDPLMLHLTEHEAKDTND